MSVTNELDRFYKCQLQYLNQLNEWDKFNKDIIVFAFEKAMNYMYVCIYILHPS